MTTRNEPKNDLYSNHNCAVKKTRVKNTKGTALQVNENQTDAVKAADQNSSGQTGKALQMNENSNEASELYEDKNAEVNGEHDKKQGKNKAIVTPNETAIPTPATD